MTNIDIGKEIAERLINFDNVNNENYYPLLDRFINEYNITDMKEQNKIIMVVVHELTIRGYDIISTEPFKIINLKD